MDTKICRVCGEPKPLSDFPNKKTGKDRHSNKCKACTSHDYRIYRETHRDQIHATNLKWQREHREHYRQSINNWNAEHREHVRSSARQRYYANKDQRNHRQRELYDAHRAENQEYRRKRYRDIAEIRVQHNLKRKRYQQKSERFQRKKVYKHWLFALEYFHGRCPVCDRPLNGLFHKPSLDHWIPVAKGGSNELDNLIPLCLGELGCNNSKASKDAMPWLIERYGKRKARRIFDRVMVFFDVVKRRQSAEEPSMS